MVTTAVQTPALSIIQQAKEWFPVTEAWEQENCKKGGVCVGGAVLTTLLTMGYDSPDLWALIGGPPKPGREMNFPTDDILGHALRILNSHFSDEKFAYYVARGVIDRNDDSEFKEAWHLLGFAAVWDGRDKAAFDPYFRAA